MHNITENHDEFIHGMYGHYAMTRESSGTSWVPQSAPMFGFHKTYHDWLCMFQGFSNLVYDHQGGLRGGKKVFDGNMFMIMAQKDLKEGTIGFRTMFSLEPWTIGKCGYPLLFQTGETCDGKTPLVDRQHPHDLFAELALVYSRTYTKDMSLFFYFGIPGEPALGPPAYFHRFSGYYNPEAPLTHHWIDSTHITFGVLTAGFIWKGIKLESSIFTGREPNQHRFDIERPRFDSYSFRFSYNPYDDLALQVSYGFLRSPEQLEPHVNSHRTRISAIHNKMWDNNNCQTTAVIGINNNMPGHVLPAFLIESTLELDKKYVIFGRFESVNKDDLFRRPDLLAGRIFTVNTIMLGSMYELPERQHLVWGWGGLLSGAFVSKAVKQRYKKTLSYMIFLQIRLV